MGFSRDIAPHLRIPRNNRISGESSTTHSRESNNGQFNQYQHTARNLHENMSGNAEVTENPRRDSRYPTGYHDNTDRQSNRGSRRFDRGRPAPLQNIQGTVVKPPRPPPAPRPEPDISSIRVPPRKRITSEYVPFGLAEAGFLGLEIVTTALVTAQDLDWLLYDPDKQLIRSPHNAIILGVAPIMFEDGTRLLGLALSTASRCLYIDCASWIMAPKCADKTHEILSDSEDGILASMRVLCVGFDLAKTIIVVRRAFQADMAGVDLSSINDLLEPGTAPWLTFRRVLGKGKNSFDGLLSLWKSNGPDLEDHGSTWGALRAWAAQATASHHSMIHLVHQAKELDSRRLGQEEHVFFAVAEHILTRMEALRPITALGEFTEISSANKKGEIVAKNEKFTSKIRKDEGQVVKVTLADGQIIPARVTKHMGKLTTFQLDGPQGNGEIQSVEVVGRASGTLADSQWTVFMREALEGTRSVHGSPHTSRLISKTAKRRGNRRLQPLLNEDVSSAAHRLNPSQREAHDAIVAPAEPGAMAVVTGPPGTGKTSVIVASVQTWLLRNPRKECIYCVTSSNVAAKNIAESFHDKDFHDFRLIVSRDFFEEWHEHRYALGKNLITTAALSATISAETLGELMSGCRVVICTLAMLSSVTLVKNGFFADYSPSSILVDEASQIRIDQYPHVFGRFKLKRVAFFGDNYQLSPYNSNQIPEMESVFDLPQLEQDQFFLDTQYRMPVEIGDFISRYVYSGRLKSADSVHKEEGCIKFIDVSRGTERKVGQSSGNEEEIRVIVNLVAKYYSKTNFKILTPYDAQRNAIESVLKKAKLPWEDRVFNVDSFQGQEEDIILISVVKTEKIGFLSENKRVNVMLTRMKKAMIILTNRMFLENQAKYTLLGKLSDHMRDKNPWISAALVKTGEAVLPSQANETPVPLPPSVAAALREFSFNKSFVNKIKCEEINENEGWGSYGISEWDKEAQKNAAGIGSNSGNTSKAQWGVETPPASPLGWGDEAMSPPRIDGVDDIIADEGWGW